ncbi:MAG: energy transducer TonB [Mucilaginibacter sp.]|uniref:energy transducer TonB n=1 Tax=Mucilaginibacter sp. TaxID=1882438 RepID=UPI003265F7B2
MEKVTYLWKSKGSMHLISMKTIGTLLIILIAFTSALAQKTDTLTIRKDTINLSGIIYDATGKPAQRVMLISKQKDIKHDQYNIITHTDTNGHFKIEGAKFNDTITVQRAFDKYTYLNNGSRFITIHLPLQTITNITPLQPVEVYALRIHPKITPTFKVTKEDNPEIFAAIEIRPEFPGGIEKFKAYIKTHLSYPEKAVQNNIEGTVQIAFTVERDGTLTAFEVLNGIGYGCDDVIINILKQSPHWKPGIAYGRVITCQQTVSVKFALTDK